MLSHALQDHGHGAMELKEYSPEIDTNMTWLPLQAVSNRVHHRRCTEFLTDSSFLAPAGTNPGNAVLPGGGAPDLVDAMWANSTRDCAMVIGSKKKHLGCAMCCQDQWENHIKVIKPEQSVTPGAKDKSVGQKAPAKADEAAGAGAPSPPPAKDPQEKKFLTYCLKNACGLVDKCSPDHRCSGISARPLKTKGCGNMTCPVFGGRGANIQTHFQRNQAGIPQHQGQR